MPPDAPIALAAEALALSLWVSAPALLASAAAGGLLAAVGVVTRVQDPSIAHAARLAAVVAVLLVLGGWMGAEILAFTRALLGALPQ
jgi:type III secretion protein S